MQQQDKLKIYISIVIYSYSLLYNITHYKFQETLSNTRFPDLNSLPDSSLQDPEDCRLPVTRYELQALGIIPDSDRQAYKKLRATSLEL
jgi:hypothetical protein